MKGYGHSSLCKGANEVGLWVEVGVGDCGFGGVQDFGVVRAGNSVDPAQEGVVGAVQASNVNCCERSRFHTEHQHRDEDAVKNPQSPT